jgi:uncharacterized protein YuzE
VSDEHDGPEGTADTVDVVAGLEPTTLPCLLTYDAGVGATYLKLADAVVARTVSVSDLVMIDLDARDEAIGVEFAVAPSKITVVMLARLAERFPHLKSLRGQ